MKLTCKRCKNSWNYKGKKTGRSILPQYTSCGKCKTNVRVLGDFSDSSPMQPKIQPNPKPMETKTIEIPEKEVVVLTTPKRRKGLFRRKSLILGR